MTVIPDASAVLSAKPVRMIQFVPEPGSTFRADVAVLFGKYLPRHGVQCELVSMPGQHSAVTAGAGHTTSSGIRARLKKSNAYWRSVIGALLRADKSHCDLIQVRDFVSVGLFALCVARLKGIPFCYWMSFLMSEARIQNARAQLGKKIRIYYCLVLIKGVVEKFLLYRLVLPGATHVFVQSAAMSEYVQSKGIAARKITAVPMGVDTEQLMPDPTAKEGPGPEPVIVYLGTLIKSRNIERLIDTLALVRVRFPAARLLLVGSSDAQSGNQDLLAYAAQLGLQDCVQITGWLPTEDAWQLVLGADAAISWVPRNLFHDVSSPTKLLEYLAAGIPSVANDIPDQVNVVNHSKAGWLTTSDTGAMASALIEILNNPAAALVRAGAGPRYIEEQRSYRVISEMVASKYRQIIKE